MGGNSASRERAVAAAESGHLGALRSAVRADRGLLKMSSDAPWSLLHVAAWSNQVKVVEYLLLEGADPNAVNTNTNETATHYAAKLGSTPILQALIQAGADVNVRNRHGNTPLHFAAESGSADACRLLVQYGADPRSANEKGATPADFARSKEAADALRPATLTREMSRRTAEFVAATSRSSGSSSALLAEAAGMGMAFTAFDWRELEIAEAVGSGGSGRVSHARWKGADVAVKQFHAMNDEDFAAEVRGIASLGNHPNLVTTYGVVLPDASRPGASPCIVSEYVAGGSLFALLHGTPAQPSRRPLSDEEMLRVALGVSKGMVFLHSKGVVHRDLKPQNVLVADERTLAVKLCDFGLARVVDPSSVMTSSLGTAQYMAPEVISGSTYDTKADVYSFGIFMWELLTSEIPFSEIKSFEIPTKVCQNYRPKTTGLQRPQPVIDLMESCWEADPSKRPAFDVILGFLERASKTHSPL